MEHFPINRFTVHVFLYTIHLYVLLYLYELVSNNWSGFADRQLPLQLTRLSMK